MPAEWDACMARDYPGITNKEAFCAWLTHQQTGKWPAEKKLTSEAFSLNLPIAKFDDQKGVVTGWAALSSVDGEPVIDFHNELLLVSELEKAAHNLMIDGGAGKAGEMHAARVGDIVESLVVTKEKAAALGLGDVKTEGWAVSMKLRDPGAIERVKRGERSELSIHGTTQKIPVGERNGQVIKALVNLSADEISIVDHGASGNDDALPKIVIAKRREQEPPAGLGPRFVSKLKKIFGKEEPMNLDEILAKLSEEERAFLLSLIEDLKAKAAPPAPPPEPEPAMKQEGEGEKKEEELSEEQMQKILKGLPEGKREAVRKRFARGDKAETETQVLRKRLDDIEEREEVAKFRTKAETLKYLAGASIEEISKVLRAAHKVLKPTEYQTIEKLLKNANTVAKDSPLFTDAGGRGNDSETTADGKLRAIAKGLRESDSKLTKEMAVSKARDENPDLRRQATAELTGTG